MRWSSAGPRCRRWPVAPRAIACWAVVCCWAAGSPGAEPSPPAIRRSAPPAAAPDSGTFVDDAFATLQGSRPDFRARGTAAPDAAVDSPRQPARARAGQPAWSTLISEGTLTDEVKDMKSVAVAATNRPTDFKGGGYDRAREAFSVLALSFAVIADHDEDVRWKKDAATARDLFARIGFNCTVGTDQSLAEARLGIVDLESLLEGSGPRRQADRVEDFLWSQVASRSALMKRLEAAEAAIGAGVAEPGAFAGSGGRILHEAEIVAAIGEVIRLPDFEDHDDGTYRGYCERMRDAAVTIRAACERGDYEAARAAAGELRNSCAACHGEYRG